VPERQAAVALSSEHSEGQRITAQYHANAD
jgi:hypothetical protein